MVCLIHEQFAEDEVTGKAHDIEQNGKNRDQHQIAIAQQKLKTAFTAEGLPVFLLLELPAALRDDVARQPRQSSANAQRGDSDEHDLVRAKWFDQLSGSPGPCDRSSRRSNPE